MTPTPSPTSRGIAVLQDETFDPDAGPWPVSGVAMSPGVTHGASGTPRLWPAETLRAAAEDNLLDDRPIVKNFHELSGQAPADDVIGRVIETNYVDDVGLVYEGEISDAEIAEKVAHGYLEVSTVPFIGAESYDSTHDAQRVDRIDGFRDIAVVATGAVEDNSIELGANPALAALTADPIAAVEALGARPARTLLEHEATDDDLTAALAETRDRLSSAVPLDEDSRTINPDEFYAFYETHGIPDDDWGALIRHVAGVYELTRALMAHTVGHDQDMMDHDPDDDADEEPTDEPADGDNPDANDEDDDEEDGVDGYGAPEWAGEAERLRLPNPNKTEGLRRILTDALGGDDAHPRDVRSIKDDAIDVDVSKNDLARDVLDLDADDDEPLDPDDPVVKQALGVDDDEDEPTPTIKDDAEVVDPDSDLAKQALGVEPDPEPSEDLAPVERALVAEDEPEPDPVRDNAEDVDLDSPAAASVTGSEPEPTPDPDLEAIEEAVAGQSADPSADEPEPDPVRDDAAAVDLDSDVAHQALGTEPEPEEPAEAPSADRWTYTRSPAADEPDDPTGMRAALDEPDDPLDDPINRQAVGIDSDDTESEEVDTDE